MPVIEFFGLSGVGKSTIVKELKKVYKLNTPIIDNMEDPWFKRNLKKIGKVYFTINEDKKFAFWLFVQIYSKKKKIWIALKSFFNFNYYGFFYLNREAGLFLLDEGIIQQVWDLYGYNQIDKKDIENIILIINKFKANKVYMVTTSKEEIIRRNKNRGKKTPLEGKLNEIDFIYYNFSFLSEVLINNDISIKEVRNDVLRETILKLQEDIKK
jgi:thymidylate kinase